MYIEGHSGIGYAIRDRVIQDEIMRFIFDKAKLNKRVRGKFTMTINGADVTVEAREYQSFDETCVELRLSKQNPKRKKKAD